MVITFLRNSRISNFLKSFIYLLQNKLKYSLTSGKFIKESVGTSYNCFLPLFTLKIGDKPTGCFIFMY